MEIVINNAIRVIELGEFVIQLNCQKNKKITIAIKKHRSNIVHVLPEQYSVEQIDIAESDAKSYIMKCLNSKM